MGRISVRDREGRFIADVGQRLGFADRLAAGWTLKAAAAAVGASPRTATRWRKDRLVVDEMARCQRNRQRIVLYRLVCEALAVYERALDLSAKPPTRRALQAAKRVLDRLGPTRAEIAAFLGEPPQPEPVVVVQRPGAFPAHRRDPAALSGPAFSSSGNATTTDDEGNDRHVLLTRYGSGDNPDVVITVDDLGAGYGRGLSVSQPAPPRRRYRAPIVPH